MSRFMLFFQSKIILAIIGALVFGGAAALIASAPPSSASNQSGSTQTQTSANVSTQGANSTTTTTSATPTSTAGTHTPTPGKSPTATPTSPPPQPSPTPTATTPTTTTLRGTVTSVDTGANSFVIRLGSGGSETVTVTSQTTFQGLCTSLSGLTAGWSVTLHGTSQPDGSFAASYVNSYVDN